MASSIPEAWSLASPEAVIGARFAAVDAALTRLLGPDIIASPEMVTLAGLARRALPGVKTVALKTPGDLDKARALIAQETRAGDTLENV